MSFSSDRLRPVRCVTVPYVFAKAAKVIPKEDGKQTVAAIGVGGSRGAFSQGGANCQAGLRSWAA